MARVDPSCGIVLWDQRFAIGEREPNTNATLTSNYTEEGPRPGQPERAGKLLAQVSGEQLVDVDITVSQPGIGTRAGAHVTVSLDSGTTELGHFKETDFRYWELAEASSGATTEWTSLAAIGTAAGTPVIVGGCGTDTLVRYFDGSAWVESTGIGLTTDNMQEGAGLAVDPVTGVLVLVGYDGSDLYTWHSADDGVTFDLVSTQSFAGSYAAMSRMALGANRGGLVAIMQAADASGDSVQLASTDLGMTWVEVASASTEGLGWSVTTVDDVLYTFKFDPTSTLLYLVRTATPLESVFAATDVSLSGRAGLRAVTGWSDRSGTLWAMFVDDGGTADTNGTIVTLRSIDGGINWTERDLSWATRATTVGPRNMVGCHTRYGAVVVCNGASPSSTDQDNSMHILWLGGWSSLEWSPGINFASSRYLWMPFAQPGGTSGLTKTGAGTATLGNGLELTDQAYYSFAAQGSAFLDFQVDTGGSLTALQCGARLVVDNGSTDYQVEIRATTTGFRVYDAVASTALGTVTIDMTTRLQIVLYRQSSSLLLYYRRPTDDAWTEVEYTGLTSTTGLTDELSWGNFTTSTQTSTWFGAGITLQFVEVTTDMVGRPTPCYLPPSVGAPAVLSLLDGPGRVGDAATIEPAALYGIRRIDPIDQPSPDVRWRSTSVGPEHVVFDLGASTEVGRAPALLLAGSLVRQVRLGYYDGADWQSAGTIDLATGFVGLEYDRVGDIIEPAAAGTVAAGRYIQAGELAGGYVIFPDNSDLCVRILDNGPGMWVDDSDVQPWIRIASTAGVSTTGEVTIVAPGGIMVTSSATTVQARYWRIRIPAQPTPDDVFEIGTILVGRMETVGATPDWAWTDETSMNVTRRSSPYGTSRARTLGPVGRAWSWSWADGQLLEMLREQAIASDYVKMTSGKALVHVEDVWWQLRSMLKTHQGLPVGALRVVPAVGETITDPSLWLYGYLEGSVAARGVIGQEGVDEMIRVDSLTVREQK